MTEDWSTWTGDYAPDPPSRHTPAEPEEALVVPPEPVLNHRTPQSHRSGRVYTAPPVWWATSDKICGDTILAQAQSAADESGVRQLVVTHLDQPARVVDPV